MPILPDLESGLLQTSLPASESISYWDSRGPFLCNSTLPLWADKFKYVKLMMTSRKFGASREQSASLRLSRLRTTLFYSYLPCQGHRFPPWAAHLEFLNSPGLTLGRANRAQPALQLWSFGIGCLEHYFESCKDAQGHLQALQESAVS